MVQGQKYNRHSVCTVCWVEYGIDTSDNMWKSINDWVGIIKRTREILKNTQSVSEIARRLGRSNNTVTRSWDIKTKISFCQGSYLKNSVQPEHVVVIWYRFLEGI